MLVVFDRHYVVDSWKCSHFLFLSVVFFTILSGIQITFIDKKFDWPIKIIYWRKSIKRYFLFWQLMDSVMFQTTLFLCIWSISSPMKFNFTRFDFFFFGFPLLFTFYIPFVCSYFFFCLFLSFFLLLSSQLCYYLLPKFFQQLDCRQHDN